MKSAMIALTLLAAGANAACATAEMTAMTECAKKINEDMTKTPVTDLTICKTYQDLLACYPTCYCEDAAYKDTRDVTEKTMKEAIESMDGGQCTLKCGPAEVADCDTSVRIFIFCQFQVSIIAKPYFYRRSTS